MKQDLMNLEEYQILSSRFESIRDEVLRNHDFRVILEYRMILQNKVLFQKDFVQNYYELKSFGRGGNNVSENIKKCILSLLRKIYPASIYLEIMQNCIRKYRLKSQKELIFFIFLYLLKLTKAQKIKSDSILNLISFLHEKIRKFIQNSSNRMLEQPQRAEFHRKNVGEFSKYLLLDLDFRNNRSIIDLKDQLRGLFLKKVKDYRKAEICLLKFIEAEPCLKERFNDLGAEGESQAEKLEQAG